jgi:transglutaminase-like putative cysteine protease
MLIAIDHDTHYRYPQPARLGVQELRLTPLSLRCQKVVSWHVEVPGINGAARYVDAYGNITHLINQTGERGELAVRVNGVVETMNTDGVVGPVPHSPPPRLFVRSTPLTACEGPVEELARSLEGRHRDQIALFHALMAEIRQRLRFETGRTDPDTTAAAALSSGHGVCQDFSHVFIAVARRLDQPARYVTGYMVTGEGGESAAEAHHAWVEAEVAGLGWVGFDPANGVCPDERYIRLACGLDADSAAPIRGVRHGGGDDELVVAVSVKRQADQ